MGVEFAFVGIALFKILGLGLKMKARKFEIYMNNMGVKRGDILGVGVRRLGWIPLADIRLVRFPFTMIEHLS